MTPSAELLAELQRLYDYNPETGKFSRRADRKGNRGGTPGEPVGFPSKGYVKISVLGKQFFAHRCAWLWVHGTLPKNIDHINMNRADNRIANLRAATSQQNKFNTNVRSNNKTGFKGVTPHYNIPGKFCAHIRINSVKKHLGVFTSPEEASARYLEVARETHGEFYRKS